MGNSHITDDIYGDEILSLLANKYNNNFNCYDEAQQEVHSKYDMLNKLRGVSAISSNTKIKNNYQKVTHIDLLNRTATLNYSDTPEPLLAYNLEYLSVRRIFPYSLNTFLDIHKGKDMVRAVTNDQKEEARRVVEWVRSRVLTTQFSLSSLSMDKNTGIFRYNTNVRDQNFGPVSQFMSCRMDVNKELKISGTRQAGKLKDLAKKYDSLFAYFMMLGFTEFYARCTCGDYIKKYSKRDGMSNYFCPHILYSMAQLPYYLLYALR